MTLPARSRGFTLIELLTVLAVLGILAGIVIPTVGGARNAADRATTKARFNQWAAAMELYRQEYGFYPAIDRDGHLDTARFVAELTGRTLTGDSVRGDPAWRNRRGLSFYTLAADDLDETGTRLVDAFGNTDIAVRVDSNRDGRIDASDTGAWVTVAGAAAVGLSPMARPEALPSTGVHAGVVFYSAGRGRDETDLVMSWR